MIRFLIILHLLLLSLTLIKTADAYILIGEEITYNGEGLPNDGSEFGGVPLATQSPMTNYLAAGRFLVTEPVKITGLETYLYSSNLPAGASLSLVREIDYMPLPPPKFGPYIVDFMVGTF